MMNHIFCFGCGHKMSYNHSAPNFCVKCGADQRSGSSRASSTQQASVQVEEAVEESLAEDETNIASVPKLRKLDVETEVFGGSVTLGQIAGEGTPPSYKGAKRHDLDDFIS